MNDNEYGGGYDTKGEEGKRFQDKSAAFVVHQGGAFKEVGHPDAADAFRKKGGHP